MFFHRADNRPRYHHGRGGGVAAVLLFRGVARFTNRIPSYVDLQIRGNDTAQFARDRWRERRVDAVAAAVSPAVDRTSGRHGRLYIFFRLSSAQ